jgi:hypothetical protein
MSCPASLTQFSVIGDCQNTGSGQIELFLSATAEPITITWIQPFESPINGQYTNTVTSGRVLIENLSAGLYILSINDSCGSPTATTENNRATLNIYVASGSSCISISDVIDTTCGLLNGSLTASAATTIGVARFDLYRNDLFIRTVNSDTGSFVFTDLEEGIYYVIGDNGGGCTGKSETCIVGNSVTLNYGLYVVDDADCGNAATGVGRLFITGLTGVPPYTYQWTSVNPVGYLESTGQSLTGTSITGLTSGSYSITITDSQNCSLTTVGIISSTNSVALGEIIPTSPTCFTPNGAIQITVIDGTPPYRYYIPSISYIDVSYSQTYTFTGLTAGFYTIEVTDAALCNFTETVTLTQPNSFGVSSVNVINSTCGQSNGALNVSLAAGGGNTYVYTLYKPDGNINQVNGTISNNFTNLSSGQYTLTVTDGICTFSGTYEIQAAQLYSISTDVTESTCGLNNGSVTITKSSGGTQPFIYSIENGNPLFDQQSPPTSSSSYTFNNLSSGFYTVTIEDAAFCNQTQYFSIDNSSQLDFTLIYQNSTTGNNGQIFANINSGNPPYTLTWSSNVNGQTGLTVTNLSAGTYTLNIIDNDGCSLEKTVILTGNYILSNNTLFEVCDSVLTSTGEFTERTLGKMLVEGYIDLTQGCVDCLFSSATFSAFTNVAGTGYSQTFYTATTLTDTPTEQQWYDAVENLLSGITGIGTVVVDTNNNTITINTDCEESTTGLANQTITVQLKIGYEINCVSCP